MGSFDNTNSILGAGGHISISEHPVLAKKFQCYAKEYLKNNYVVYIVPVTKWICTMLDLS
jgi:hypothetical protein